MNGKDSKSKAMFIWKKAKNTLRSSVGHANQEIKRHTGRTSTIEFEWFATPCMLINIHPVTFISIKTQNLKLECRAVDVDGCFLFACKQK